MSFWRKVRVAAQVIFVSVISAQAAVAMPQPLEPAIPADGVIKFDVYRKGDRIGTHTFTFKQDADSLEVDIDVKFKVKFLFVTVYKYRHESREIWSDGRLVSMQSETEQNGKEWELKAECGADQTQVALNGERFAVPSGLLPTSYWNVLIVEKSTLLNTQFGSAIDVNVTAQGEDTVEAMGQPVETMRYNIKAFIEETQQPVNVDIWYDRSGELMKMQFVAKDGSVVEYKRVG